MSETAVVEPDVVLRTVGSVARIELNRPRAINALTHEMVVQISRALAAWRTDSAIDRVLLTGRGGRGLCAGGDVVALHRDAVEGVSANAARFWADEYRLNLQIAQYPKPFVAIMDGIVLGGGIGVSAHASHRIVTDSSSIGLPETTIGFVPDVGATWLLSRAPGELGTYLAMTASSVGAADAIAIGLADHYVAQDRLDSFVDAFMEGGLEDVIEEYAAPAPGAVLQARRSWIDSCFAHETVSEILAALAEEEDEEAQRTIEVLTTRSPSAVAVTLESIRRARRLDSLAAALRQEYRVSLHALVAPDFAEGVRAQVIDKDRQPRWSPADLSEITAEAVAAYFEPVEGGDPDLDPDAVEPAASA